MRNLKKILALVLALVMSLSLVTMANADYADQADIDNDEAVAVMSALGILEGSDGKFNPDGILTREQAAKIITYMLLGAEKADKLTTTIAPFSDVEATRWSAGAVAYCADQGILDGVGGGKFAPTAKLTGLQFAKMVLGALGYDAAIEGLTGETFAIKTATLAIDLGLDKDVSVDLAKELSRENAAQMAFNALECKKVSYTGGTTVELPGGTKVVVGAIQKEGDVFGKKYEDKLEKVDAEDETFKRPNSYTWQYDGEDVYTASKGADETYTGEVKALDIWKDLGKPSDKLTVTCYKNAKSVAAAAIEKDAKGTFGGLNTAVEVYYDKDAKAVTVIEIEYAVGTVSKVNAEKVDKWGDVTEKANVVIEGKKFETTAFEKDDVVLYAVVAGEIEDVKLADSFTGKVTAVKGDKVTIGGASYVNAAALDVGSEGTFYQGVCGAIVKAEATKTTSEDWAYIYNIVDNKDDDEKNEDGFTVAGASSKTAYVVLADGTKAAYTIADDDATKAAAWAIGDVVCYEINSDDEIAVAVNGDTAATAAAKVNFGKSAAIVNGKYSSADTDFIFSYVKKEAGKADVLDTKTITGYKNVVAAEETVVVIYNKDNNKALTVFVMAAAATETVEAKDIYVLMSAEATKTLDEDDKTVYSYDVQVNGEADTLTAKTQIFAGKDAGFLFTVTLKDDVVDSFDAVATKAGNVDAIVDEYAVIDGATYYFAEDVEIYEVDTEDGYALESAELAEDDTIAFVQVGGTDDDKDDICYVLITARAE